MLVSDLSEAQDAAVRLGAVRGFGKAHLGERSTLELVVVRRECSQEKVGERRVNAMSLATPPVHPEHEKDPQAFPELDDGDLAVIRGLAIQCSFEDGQPVFARAMRTWICSSWRPVRLRSSMLPTATDTL